MSADGNLVVLRDYGMDEHSQYLEGQIYLKIYQLVNLILYLAISMAIRQLGLNTSFVNIRRWAFCFIHFG